MDDRRSLTRSAGLFAVAFVATLILLAGLLLGLRGPSREGGAASGSATPSAGAGVPSSPPASASAAASPGRPSSEPVPGASSPPPSGDPVIVGAGDIGDCTTDDDEATAALIDDIPGTVFTAGDNAYPEGTSEQYRDCYEPTWGRFKDRTRPAPGNHDHRTKGAAGYLAYFGDAAVNGDGQPWYSFDLGAWHVVVLDSECEDVGGCAAGDPQGRWLAADLAASTAACTLAIWHVPRFSSGFHGNDRSVAPFWDALYAAGADVIVNGHDHDYERFAPQDPSGSEDRERGIREFVAGTGGTDLRKFEETARNSELRATVSHGVLELTLHARGYDWKFVPTTGRFSDSGSAACH
jgi:hypothetical protein